MKLKFEVTNRNARYGHLGSTTLDLRSVSILSTSFFPTSSLLTLTLAPFPPFILYSTSLPTLPNATSSPVPTPPPASFPPPSSQLLVPTSLFLFSFLSPLSSHIPVSFNHSLCPSLPPPHILALTGATLSHTASGTPNTTQSPSHVSRQ